VKIDQINSISKIKSLGLNWQNWKVYDWIDKNIIGLRLFRQFFGKEKSMPQLLYDTNNGSKTFQEPLKGETLATNYSQDHFWIHYGQAILLICARRK